MSGPALPTIGQPDYIPLLLKSLQTYHAPYQLDSHIFIVMLLALIAGEKNLIVDVDTSDLTAQYRAAQQQHSPLAETLQPSRALDEYRKALAVVETRVQTAVEYVSVFIRAGL
ncbi:hypothetical protein NCC49_006051 [Naganishia albida]|nr:hypothetical protein NCC49_006051 [Naganishia albida]